MLALNIVFVTVHVGIVRSNIQIQTDLKSMIDGRTRHAIRIGIGIGGRRHATTITGIARRNE